MSFVQNTFGQNSSFFNVAYQTIDAKDLNFSNSHPFELAFGYQSSNHLIGIVTSLNVVANTYKQTDILTTIDRNSKYFDNSNEAVRNTFLGFSIGPSINVPFSDFLKVKILPSIVFGEVYSKGNYDDRRVYITPIADNTYINGREEITSSQSKSYNSFTSYINLGICADLSNLPIGLEIGWQSLDFGKSMNNLNPEGKYTKNDFNTKTSAIYIKLYLYLRKKDD